MADILVNIDVGDLENGSRFYVHGLDLKLGRRLGAQACELLGGSSPIYLLEKGRLARMADPFAAGATMRSPRARGGM